MGGRSAGCCDRAAPPRARDGGSRVSRVFDHGTAEPERSGARALHARRHRRAVARPRGLLHAVRRRPRAAAERGRSLRHHERRRRVAAALPRGAAARAAASSATSSSSPTAGRRTATTTRASRAPCCRCRPTPAAATTRRRGRLEDDPVYRQHRDDFAKYHTRYVTSDPVRDALRAAQDAAARGVKRP